MPKFWYILSDIEKDPYTSSCTSDNVSAIFIDRIEITRWRFLAGTVKIARYDNEEASTEVFASKLVT